MIRKTADDIVNSIVRRYDNRTTEYSSDHIKINGKLLNIKDYIDNKDYYNSVPISNDVLEDYKSNYTNKN